MLTSTTTSMLRVGVGRPSAIQPAFLLRSAACPYSTLKTVAAPLTTSSRPTRTASKPSPPLSSVLVRRISTSPPARRPQTSTTTPPSSSSSRPTSDHDLDAAAAARLAAEPPLDWNTFFRLRKTRRRWQLLFSVACSLAAGTGGALALTTGAADELVAQVPLDPMITLGLIVFASAALGWLAGPSLGSQVFYAINRRYKAQMTVKEVQFFARVKKNRVDPSNSSAGNPVPDFYGEKISSVAGYRQWLKDQRAFNKKRTTFV